MELQQLHRQWYTSVVKSETNPRLRNDNTVASFSITVQSACSSQSPWANASHSVSITDARTAASTFNQTQGLPASEITQWALDGGERTSATVPEHWWAGRWALWPRCTRSLFRTHLWAADTWRWCLLRGSSEGCPPCMRRWRRNSQLDLSQLEGWEGGSKEFSPVA